MSITTHDYTVCSLHLLANWASPCIFTTTNFNSLLQVVFNSCHEDKFQWWYYFRLVFSAEMLFCFFADSFRVRFLNFVSLWCFSPWFRGGRSATTGLTFIPCPHWVLRPHLNCLTLWGRLSETFSAQKPQMATFTTCWLVPIFVKSRALGSVLMYSAELLANCSQSVQSALRFSSTLSSMEIVNKQRGTYEQFLGRNFIGLITLGIEIRGAWVIYVALQQALPWR